MARAIASAVILLPVPGRPKKLQANPLLSLDVIATNKMAVTTTLAAMYKIKERVGDVEGWRAARKRSPVEEVKVGSKAAHWFTTTGGFSFPAISTQ